MSMSRRQWMQTFGWACAGSYLSSVGWAQEPLKVPPPADMLQPGYDPLLEKVEQAIAVTSRRQLIAGDFSPWQVVHGILALRQDLILKQPDGKEISGIEWMASGALWKGQTLFEKTEFGGRGRPFTKPYDFEGHPTQFLGYMCEADLPLDYEFQAGADRITIQDILNDAQQQLTEGPEVTWTLWALAHYLEPTAEWKNSKGEPWSIERMVQIQTQEAVLNGACGGCHGLYAIAYARNQCLAKKIPLRGVWLQADQKIKRYVYEAQALQNSYDGSFSSAYFKGREWSQEFSKRLPANGHILEFLMVALNDQQIKEQWVRRGVESVAQDLIDNRRTPSDCGPLFHALHALKMYNLRANPNTKAYATRPPLKSQKSVAAAQAAADEDRQPPVLITQEPTDSVTK